MPLPSNGRICGGGKRGRAGERKICGRGSMEKRPSRAAQKGSRDNVPCRVKGRRPLWGLGQRPNCFTCDHSKGKINKGAGSEASLPVTLRSRRSAPKPLYLPLAYCRADGRDRPVSREVFSCCWSFLSQGDAPAGATRGQWKQTKSAVAPLTPSQCAPMIIVFFVAGRNERYTKL